MATEDVKAYLEETLGVPEKQWKRVRKQTLADGTEVRVFRNKQNGNEIETHEMPNGEIRIHKNIVVANNPITIDAIQRFYCHESVDVSVYPDLASHFTFCFSSDANPDHDMEMEEMAEALELGEDIDTVYVTGFNLLIVPQCEVASLCTHIGDLIGHLLPSYLDEVEESTFCIHSASSMIYSYERRTALEEGTIPRVTYQDLIHAMESAGFVYDSNRCLLGVFESITSNSTPTI